MTRVPISAQMFPPDDMAHLQHCLRNNKPITGELVLKAIEQFAARPMPALIAKLIKTAAFNTPIKKGRPRAFNATQDFAFFEFDARYHALLRKYRRDDQQKREDARARGDQLPRGEYPPSERAYRALASRFRTELGVRDWRSLRNQHTKWKRGHFHKLEDNPEPFEFDEMVEKHFPAPRNDHPNSGQIEVSAFRSGVSQKSGVQHTPPLRRHT